MPNIKVTGLTHEEWGRFWRASLEAIEPGSSGHCLAMNIDHVVSVYHHRLDAYIERSDWRNEPVRYESGDRTLYEGTVQVPSSVETIQMLHRIFVAFNRMAPISYDTGLMWTGKSMSVGDIVSIDGLLTYRCTDTGWSLI